MIMNHYLRTLRPVYDKDFKYAGPQACVATGATNKAAKYAQWLADIAVRIVYMNTIRAAKEATKVARDEAKKANPMAKTNAEVTPEATAKAAESARRKACRAANAATVAARASWKADLTAAAAETLSGD
jgi:hypothetical protein